MMGFSQYITILLPLAIFSPQFYRVVFYILQNEFHALAEHGVHPSAQNRQSLAGPFSEGGQLCVGSVFLCPVKGP